MSSPGYSFATASLPSLDMLSAIVKLIGALSFYASMTDITPVIPIVSDEISLAAIVICYLFSFS